MRYGFYEVWVLRGTGWALSLHMHSMVPGQVLLGLKAAEKQGRCLYL